MGVLARVAGIHLRGTPVMRTNPIERRRVWRAMSSQDKHQRLRGMRQLQQHQVEAEMLRLTAHLR